MDPPRGQIIYIHFLEFFWKRYLSFLFINLLIYLHQYGLMDISFLFCVIVQKHFYFLKLGLLSVGLCVSSICFHQCRGVVCVLSTPLLPGTIRISRHIFMSCLSTKISHFSKDPWFFLLENGVGGQDLDAKYDHVTGMSLLLDTVIWHSKEICLYLNPCIDIYMYL